MLKLTRRKKLLIVPRSNVPVTCWIICSGFKLAHVASSGMSEISICRSGPKGILFDLIGGDGPRGFAPSKKQSMGLIQTQGMSRSNVGFRAWAIELLEISREPGLKQMSSSRQ